MISLSHLSSTSNSATISILDINECVTLIIKNYFKKTSVVCSIVMHENLNSVNDRIEDIYLNAL